MEPIAVLRSCAILALLAGCVLESPRGDGPILLSERVERAFERYKNEDNPKHFAVSVDGEDYGYSFCPEFRCSAAGQKVALDDCARRSNGKVCKLYASGRTVIWDGPVDAKTASGQMLDIGQFADVGLRSETRMQQLVAAVCSVDRTLSARNLADELHQALSAGLGAYLPAPKVQFDENTPLSANFDYENWTIRIRDNNFDVDAFNHSMMKIAPIVFHEVRHADQFFAAAKYQASLETHLNNKPAFLGLPDRIVELAAGSQISLTEGERGFGRAFYDDSVSPDDRLRKIFLIAELEQTKGSEDYGDRYDRFFEKLWEERDAAAFEKAATNALEECLLEQSRLQ